MKNKLLVSVFAMALAVFAFTSCENKSDVTAVCTDLLKATLHGANTGTSGARGYVKQDGQQLIIAEYEFPSKNVNDPVLLFRTMAFGDGVYVPKKVDTLSYEYGEWQDQGTVFTLLVTPRTGDPYVLKYLGDGFVAPDGRVYGGSSAANVARVEKWEKVTNTLPNTKWEGAFKGDFVLDSAFRDSIKFVPFPRPGHYDTIPWFDHWDTVAADTACYYKLSFERDLTSFVNTGHYYRRAVRSKYDRETKQSTILSEDIYEYDFHWMFTEVSSDKKFTIQLANTTTPGVEGDKLSIAEYTLDSLGVPSKFLLGGIDYTRPVLP